MALLAPKERNAGTPPQGGYSTQSRHRLHLLQNNHSSALGVSMALAVTRHIGQSMELGIGPWADEAKVQGCTWGEPPLNPTGSRRPTRIEGRLLGRASGHDGGSRNRDLRFSKPALSPVLQPYTIKATRSDNPISRSSACPYKEGRVGESSRKTKRSAC